MREAAKAERNELVLSGCPCPLVAPERPEALCHLARGVVDGVLAGCGSAPRVTDSAHDPGRRLCRARLGTGG
jgi:hypothetical protein